MESLSSNNIMDTLRIACLEPSATAICFELGLEDSLVGITHECHEMIVRHSPKLTSSLRVLTKNGLAASMTQGEIHQAVQDTAAAVAACSRTITASEVPSLYPLRPDQIQEARPSVIFTQNLCSVCAPTEKDVQQVLLEGASSLSSPCQVVSLQPQTLDQVAESFVTVARACGVEERGQNLKDTWMQRFQQLKLTVETHRDATLPTPRGLILEWLDPPFDGGHWTFQMMDYAGVEAVNRKTKTDFKSKAMQWSDVASMDPDVIVVGCCGFDLERNVRDMMGHAAKFQALRAAQLKRTFACNGNEYIAQPGPSLLQGAVILAKCAYQHQPSVLQAIDALGFFQASGQDEATAWKHVDLSGISKAKKAKPDLFQPMASSTTVTRSSDIPDIEDLMGGGGGGGGGTLDRADTNGGFAAVHKTACERGESTYIDPATGYSVFTAVAHNERGWCCGSGCRHCPYGHENIQMDKKATKIQQPSILYRMEEKRGSNHHDKDQLFSLQCGHHGVKVLFFSGGKDSFLTLRALARDHGAHGPFGLVLLTTFDASTRTIAHQNVPIDHVVQQAQHLNITLVGVPIRGKGSGETYLERIQQGLHVIEKELTVSGVTVNSSNSRIQSLVFGDLHLEQIQEWRNKTFRDLPYVLEYPLWKVPYETLMEDLEASQVPCVVSGTTRDTIVQEGTAFDRSLYNRVTSLGLDGFGERGEFHSLAKVWKVPRKVALLGGNMVVTQTQ